jgi:hypothetical protein
VSIENNRFCFISFMLVGFLMGFVVTFSLFPGCVASFQPVNTAIAACLLPAASNRSDILLWSIDFFEEVKVALVKSMGHFCAGHNRTSLVTKRDSLLRKGHWLVNQ